MIETPRRSAVSSRAHRLHLVLPAFLALVAVPALDAAPLDAARAHLEAGRLAEAYEALLPELEADHPPADAYRLALDALLAQGRLVTAGDWASRWIESRRPGDGAPPADWVPALRYGGLIDALTGDQRRAIERYRLFVSFHAVGDDAAREALEFLLAHDPRLAEWQLYARLFGASPDARELGTQAAALLLQRDVGEFLRCAEHLLQLFPSAEDAARIIPRFQPGLDRLTLDEEQVTGLDRMLLPAVNRPGASRLTLETIWDALPRQAGAACRFALLQRLHEANDLAPLDRLDRFAEVLRGLRGDELAAAARVVVGYEPIYSQQATPEQHAEFLRILATNPDLFKTGGVVTAGRLSEMLARFVARAPAPGGVDTLLVPTAQNYIEAPADRARLFRDYVAAMGPAGFAAWVATGDGAAAGQAMDLFAASHATTDTIRARAALLAVCNREQRKDDLLDTGRACVRLAAAAPAGFDAETLARELIASPLLTDAERGAFLEAAAAEPSSLAVMSMLLGAIVNPTEPMPDDRAAAWRQWRESAAFKEFERAHAARIEAADDPVLRVHDRFTRQFADNSGAAPAPPDLAIANEAAAFLKAYDGPVPAEASRAASAREFLVWRIGDRHRRHVAGHPAGLDEWARLWAPRLGPGELFDIAAARLGPAMAERYAVMLEAGAAPHTPTLWALAEIRELGIGDDGFIPVPAAALRDAHVAAALLRAKPAWRLEGGPEFFTDLMWTYATGGERHAGEYDRLKTMAKCHWQYVRAGHKEKGATALAEFLRRVAAESAADRINAINVFIDNSRDASDELTLQQLPALYRDLPGYEVGRATAFVYVWQNLDYWLKDPGTPAEMQARARELRDLIAGRVAQGLGRATGTDPTPESLAVAKDWMLAATRERRWPELARRVAPYAAWTMHDGLPGDAAARDAFLATRYTNAIAPVADALDQAGAGELAYAMLGAVGEGNLGSAWLTARLNEQRSRLAVGLDVIPVPRNDPLYPLHAAAREMRHGDPGRAWDLTRRNLDLLVARWRDLPRDYVVWTLDQMRKRELYDDGIRLASDILLGEGIEPATAARVSLLRGDLFRDARNLDAARIEYQTLRDNPQTRETEAGQLAQYRLIALMIDSRAYDNAEPLIERLLDAPAADARAEALFLKARIAFDREAYDECKPLLDQALELAPSHAEAILLEGRLRLHRERGLEEVEIRLGEKQLRTVLVPGRPLRLILPDPTLGVVRQGKEVPVRLTTEPGGDEEVLMLYPSADDDRTFAGALPTTMAPIRKGNGRLELHGDDRISYQMDPDFQKRFELRYDAKYLEVKSAARLTASSGAILSEEENDRRRLEERLGTRAGRRAADEARPGVTVRPGSPIYVQVSDADRNVSDARDQVAVNLRTTSGDSVRAALTETGEQTGVFRGEIPTGIPFARVETSDSDEASDPNAVISSVRKGFWRSLSDGVKPKWLMIDAMTSYEVSEAELTVASTGALQRLSAQACLHGEPVTIAEYPAPPIMDGLWLQAGKGGAAASTEDARALVGDTPPLFQRADFTPKRGTRLVQLAEPVILPAAVAFEDYDGPLTLRLTGSFHLAEPLDVALECHGLGTNRFAELRVDDTLVFQQKPGAPPFAPAGPAPPPLAAGAHSLELIVLSPDARWEAFAVGHGGERFRRLPADIFSAHAHAELETALSPNAELAIEERAVHLRLRDPVRYRKLKWVFEDFAPGPIEIAAARVRDAAGTWVIPVEHDFSMGLRNDVLEIAPGDNIDVSYHDEKRLSEESPILTASLNAAYADGVIALEAEVIGESVGGERALRYYPVRRCCRGDTLMIVIRDLDEDQSPARDRLDVSVATGRGDRLTLRTEESGDPDPSDAAGGIHSGVFRALVRLGSATSNDTIRLESGDTLTASYLDRENLNPGVPVAREVSVQEAGESTPELFVLPNRIELAQDTSPAAREQIARLSRKDYNLGRTNLQIWTRQVVSAGAGAPGAAGEAAATAGVDGAAMARLIAQSAYRTSLEAPIQIRVLHPAAARHEASRFKHVTAVTQSELDEAAKAGREPEVRRLSCRLSDLESGLFAVSLKPVIGREEDRAATETPAEGAAAGTMAESAEPPSEDEDEGGDADVQTTRSTLFVRPNDIVHLGIEDENGQALARKTVALASDASLELMDRSFTARSDTLHLGDAFYARVVDLDRDVTSGRDTVTVHVAAASGADVAMTLAESFPHAGVFEGELRTVIAASPAPAGDAAAAAHGAEARVTPGDTLTFVYQDDQRVDESNAPAVTAHGFLLPGADAQLAAFSRQFQDPEMAVKTGYLMAEALFEMAKDQRNLGQTNEADRLIGRGREVLEEAMRDNPRTSLAARGEFLLANLAEESGFYDDAIRRYAEVVSGWPDSEYAPRALFKKALCLEKKGDDEAALEDYVRLTYLYKSDEMAADAVVRLASYYYKKEMYDTSAEIFTRFQQANPGHRLAAKSLALAGLSHMKGEDYERAMRAFDLVVSDYPDDKDVRSEAMYWLGDSAVFARDYARAYQAFKQLTWDYPDSKWAKMARGRLTENVLLNEADKE